MKLPKLKKLNAKGFSHHLLIAVIVISGIAGFGAWRVYSSSAAVNYAGLCGSGYGLKKVLADSYGNYSRGEVRVYAKQSGTNTDWCSFTVHKSATWGYSLDTFIQTTGYNTMSQYEAGNGISRKDKGNYKYYAGPVRVDNTRNLRVYGDIRGQINGKDVPFTLKATFLSN